MTKLTAKLAIASIVSLCCLVMGVSIFYFGSGYLNFIHRGPTYYSNLAQACDEVLAKARPEEYGHKLYAKSIVLPDPIKALHPAYVVLDSNRVYIRVGADRGGYGISWQPGPYTPPVWQLTAHGEDLKTVVFKKPVEMFPFSFPTTNGKRTEGNN